MIQIPIQIIYALLAIIIGSALVGAIVYHFWKIDKVKKKVKTETMNTYISKMTPMIAGNKLMINEKVFELVPYQVAEEIDLVKVDMIPDGAFFEEWFAKKIEQMKLDIVKRFPFKVERQRVEGTNIQRIVLTTYAGVEK